jgi:hypothetical protein
MEARRVRVSEGDLVKKLLRQVLTATPDELALMAESILGVKATYDQQEFCQWEVEPAGNYSGAFDIELGPSPQGGTHE